MNDSSHDAAAIAASAALLRNALDSDLLTQSSREGLAVDRVYTALHVYLSAVCDTQGRAHTEPQCGITELFEWLREHHPALKSTSDSQAEVEGVLTALCVALDTLNSVWHPPTGVGARDRVDESEASLAIDAARAVFVYVDAMLQSHDANDGRL